MMFIKLISLSIVCLQFVSCGFISNQQYFRTPLVSNNWPPRQNRNRNSGSTVRLQFAGSNNIMSHVSLPAYYRKDLLSQFPLRSKFNNLPLKSLLYQSHQKNIITNGPPKITSQIRRPPKTLNKIAPLSAMKQTDYIYEKINLQTFSKTFEPNESTSPIHEIEAPNLTAKYYNQMNKNVDISEFEKMKPFGRQGHQYQVRENFHDSTDINQLDTIKNNPYNEFPQTPRTPFHTSNDITPESDVKDLQSIMNVENLNGVTASLVQLPMNQYDEIYLPQLQKYILEQKSILPHANAYNPSYLVMQSKNLLSKYQKLWTGKLKNENGYKDTSLIQEPGQNFQPFVHAKPKHGVTITQIDTTISPKSESTQNTYENLSSEIQSSPTSSQLVDNNPSYLIQYKSDINISKQEKTNQEKDFRNQMNDGTYHGHQLKNDLILKEAEKNLQKQTYQKQQREQSTLDLHQQAIVEQFKDSVLRIVVTDKP